MEERGICGGKHVVAYDNGLMLFATRFWWAARVHGLDAAVSVLDGGWAKWEAEGRPVTADCQCPLNLYGAWTAEPGARRPALVCSADDVFALLAAEMTDAALPMATGAVAAGPAPAPGTAPAAAMGTAALSAAATGAASAASAAIATEAASNAGTTGAAPIAGSNAADGARERNRVQIVDARSRDQFRGEVRRARRGGHVPGSLNVPYRSLLEPCGRAAGSLLEPGGGAAGSTGGSGGDAGGDGGISSDGRCYHVLKGKEGLRQTLEEAGVDPAAPTVALCNGGVASTLVAFACHLLGNDDVRNYDGSWNE
ncbi:unnamed protein product, partial [Phaeothamnion confervicola]